MKNSGNKGYSIEYINETSKKDHPELSASAKALIKRAIEERLMVDPISFGKPLRYTLNGYRSLRVSKYRIIYKIEQENRKVVIYAIYHRKDAYIT